MMSETTGYRSGKMDDNNARAPQSESEIRGLLSRLEHALRELTSNMDVLSNRLAPVLESGTPEMPANKEAAARPPASPLGGTLLEYVVLVEVTVRSTRALIHRLAL